MFVSFIQWLRKQKKRNDPVGDLATDYVSSCRWERWNSDSLYRTNKITHEYLDSIHACDGAHEALNQALDEYATYVRETVDKIIQGEQDAFDEIDE